MEACSRRTTISSWRSLRMSSWITPSTPIATRMTSSRSRPTCTGVSPSLLTLSPPILSPLHPRPPSSDLAPLTIPQWRNSAAANQAPHPPYPPCPPPTFPTSPALAYLRARRGPRPLRGPRRLRSPRSPCRRSTRGTTPTTRARTTTTGIRLRIGMRWRRRRLLSKGDLGRCRVVVGLLLCVSWILAVGPGFCFGMIVLL